MNFLIEKPYIQDLALLFAAVQMKIFLKISMAISKFKMAIFKPEIHGHFLIQNDHC